MLCHHNTIYTADNKPFYYPLAKKDTSFSKYDIMFLFHRAADLGNATSYYNIGNGYFFGRGVEIDKKMARHYYELGAMRGCVLARYNLAVIEENSGDMNRAIKHYIISAGSGFNKSLDVMQDLYSKGKATKDEYTKALRAYQNYLDEVKSDQRDEAAAAREIYEYIDYSNWSNKKES